jgi:hypothetical protein
LIQSVYRLTNSLQNVLSHLELGDNVAAISCVRSTMREIGKLQQLIRIYEEAALAEGAEAAAERVVNLSESEICRKSN